jgi:hypothetical protein
MDQEEILSTIREAALQNDIPEDIFIRLIRKESGFNPDVVSPKGAKGLAQLMPGTAEEMGVYIDDPIMNVFGGAKYLRSLFDRYGDWPTAVAAYNSGPTAVNEAGRSVPMDRPETLEYVANILGGYPREGETIVPLPKFEGTEGAKAPPPRPFDLEGISGVKAAIAGGMSKADALRQFVPGIQGRYRNGALPALRPPPRTDIPDPNKPETYAKGGPVRGSSLDINIFAHPRG